MEYKDPVATHCPEHPKVSTNLRCSRCEKPVCAECLVQAPVGIRCREHGKAQKLPTYDIPTRVMVGASLVGIALGIGGGAILGLLVLPLVWSIPYASLAGLVGFGYLVGEIISRVSNKKRGPALAIVAGGSVILAFIVIVFFTTVAQVGTDIFDLLGAGIATYIAIIKVR